jgi:hypothetical protein
MRSARGRDAGDVCPAPEDLTAHAHHEGDGPTRARIARHLLACGACRTAHDADVALFTDLAALGAMRSVPPPAEPQAPVPVAARGPRGLTAWLPPVAAAAVIGLALLLPTGREPQAGASDPAVAMTAGAEGSSASAPSARLVQLLGAQADDGRWAAEAGPLAQHDCASTALVLLALHHEREMARGTLDRLPGLVDALGSGTGWLLERLEAPDRPLADLPTAERSVLLAALARSFAQAPSERLRTHTAAVLHTLERTLAREGADLAVSTRPWIAYALEAAERAGVDGAAELRRDVEPTGWLAASGDRTGAAFPRLTPMASDAPCSPLRSALEVLRDEPPLRTLALGPPCRPPTALALR